MKILANKDTKGFFLALCAVLAAFFLGVRLVLGDVPPALLVLLVLLAAGVLAVCLWYVCRQEALLENAISQVSDYLAGNADARIDCNKEGTLYRLFHCVNTLAAVLNAHAANELWEKEFLKNTISDISHQLKTPLAALNIYNGLIQDEAAEDPEMLEFAALSEQELDRIDVLVQNLLKITKLDAGAIRIEKSDVTISDMLKDVQLHFAYRAKQEQKSLLLSGPEGVTFSCDWDWMMEALDNLVKNALDHTKPGGWVRIDWRRSSTALQIQVRDNGAGIHPEDLHHIFKRFYRSRFSQDTQGIGLFLSFSVLIELVGYMMSQFYAAPDIEISCTAVSETIAPETADAIAAMDAVTQVYGRKTAFALPAVLADGTSCEIDLISFDDFDLEGLQKDGTLKQGSDLSKVYGNSAYVLATWDQDSPLQIGDTLTVDGQTLAIGGLLKYDPFTASGATEGQITLISSAATFTRLTGCTGYTLLMAQTTGDMTEEDLAAIRSLLPETCTLRDLRDQSTANTYTAFLVCVYGFLLIITLVSVLNIVNSISMSVSARAKQYGAMRAAGMDAKQITAMIATEAATYALFGCLTGCTLGLLLSKLLYGSLITSHYSYALWHVPTGSLVLILLFVTAATALAIHAPAKRIRTMSITEIINEL